MFKKLLFLRTFITFFFVVSVYTFVLAGITLVQQSSQYSHENELLNKQFLEKNSASIDSRLELLMTYLSFLSEKDSFRRYVLTDDVDFSNYSDLYDDIVNSLFSTNQLGFNIGVVRSLNGYVVSSNGYYLFDDYVSHLNLDKHLFNLKNLILNKTSSNYEYFTGKDSSVLVMKQEYKTVEKPVFIFVVFNNEMILPESLPNEQGAFLLGNIDDSLFFMGEERQIKTQLPEIFFTSTELIKEKVKNKTYYVRQSQVIPTLNYYYVNENPSSLYMIKRVLPGLLPSVGLLVIFGTVVSFLLSKKFYSPINQVMKELDGENQRDELGYIIANVKKVNETNKELELEFSKTLYARQEQFLKDITYGAISDSERDEQLEKLYLTKLKKGGTLTVFSIEGMSTLEANLSKTNVLTLRRTLLSTYAADNEKKSYTFFTIDHQHFCVLFFGTNLNKVTREVERLIDFIENEGRVDITCSIANPFHDISEISYAFNEALALESSKYNYVDSRVIGGWSDKVQREDYDFSFDSEQIFIQMLKAKNTDGAMLYISDVIVQNFEKEMNKESIVGFIYVLVNTMKRVLNSYDKSFAEFSQFNKTKMELLKSTKPEVLEDTLIRLFSELILFIDVENRGKNKPTHERVLEYIHNYYDQDISLTSIAETLNLSESYVSRVVSEKTKTSFKNYVNSLKVERAKELLTTGKYQVQEVSQKVGCNNVNTFIRIFKQFEGCSPGKYFPTNK